MKIAIPALSLFLLVLQVIRLTADEPLTFEQHVRPILQAYCLDCHGAGDYQRSATDVKIVLASQFLAMQIPRLRANIADPELAALTNLCQQLLSSNEFLHVDGQRLLESSRPC